MTQVSDMFEFVRRWINTGMRWISGRMLRYLNTPTYRYAPFFGPELNILARALKPGDVLLVEGNTRLSAVIKYLTQSTWSHAALYIGDALGPPKPGEEPKVLIDAEAEPGVRAIPLSTFAHFNTRICRPVGLSEEDRKKLVAFAVSRLGTQYDTKQILDLARYLFPYPPVPIAIRRRLLAIGSGDPTRAICSTLIAESFYAIHYPILPERVVIDGKTYGVAPYVQGEVDHIRKYGLFTPRDFDVSPYFAVIKPTIERGFDFHALTWAPATFDGKDYVDRTYYGPP
jgi:Permuted papain-like amidase enzyme, YaeF/YiiX, C92 family